MSGPSDTDEAFAEAYSRARYGWSLAQYDTTKQGIARAEAAALLTLARSGWRPGTTLTGDPLAGLTVERLMTMLAESANAGWLLVTPGEPLRRQATAMLAKLKGEA